MIRKQLLYKKRNSLLLICSTIPEKNILCSAGAIHLYRYCAQLAKSGLAFCGNCRHLTAKL